MTNINRDNDKRPSTYFLQEAIERGFSAISARLDPSMANRPYFMIELRPEPKLLHEQWDMGDMCSRYADAFILGRQVIGNTDFYPEENDLRQLLYQADPYAEPFMAGRMLIAFVDMYLMERSDEAKKRINDLVATIKSKLTFEDDYAYYFKAPSGWTSKSAPVFGAFQPYPSYPLGGIMLALARYLEEADDSVCADLMEKLTVFLLYKSGVFNEDGSYYGHTHSGGILTAALAIFRRSVYTGNFKRIDMMRNTLDWTLMHCSSWGWVPDGLGSPDPSSETCAIVDAIHFAILAARYIDHRYYDIVERFAMNQLLENQFRHPERMLPPEYSPYTDKISRAINGSWASWSLPNCLDNAIEHIEGCCLGSGIRGCYLVWNSAVELLNGTVRVNMMFTRNSPWVEIVSSLPYAGQIDLRMHTSHPMRIRIPDGVNVKELSLSVNNMPVDVDTSDGRYIDIKGLVSGDIAVMKFPVKAIEKTETVSGSEYNVRWRGNTVTEINPKGISYPIFERNGIFNTDAPLVDLRYIEQKGDLINY